MYKEGKECDTTCTGSYEDKILTTISNFNRELDVNRRHSVLQLLYSSD